MIITDRRRAGYKRKRIVLTIGGKKSGTLSFKPGNEGIEYILKILM